MHELPFRFIVYSIGKGRYMVQSIPGELSLQETSVLTAAANQGQGFVTIDLLIKQLGFVGIFSFISTVLNLRFLSFSWNEFRANQAIDKVVGDGLAWIDQQGEETSYWFPSLFPGRLIGAS